MDMGIVNAGQLGVYEEIPPELLEHVEDILFDRRPDATERMVEFAETVKGKGRKKELDLAWRDAPGRAAPRARAGPRRARLHRGRHRGGAPELRAAARGDRRPADGRHEDRRRPVRRRQDVPAAGGEERARDEARRRLPEPLHGGREGRLVGLEGPHRDGHRQGRRPRHRQEHRRRGARLQQLRGDRPRRDGAVRPDPEDRRRARLRPDRPLGPDHALARRDGERGQGDAAPRARSCRC